MEFWRMYVQLVISKQCLSKFITHYGISALGDTTSFQNWVSFICCHIEHIYVHFEKHCFFLLTFFLIWQLLIFLEREHRHFYWKKCLLWKNRKKDLCSLCPFQFSNKFGRSKLLRLLIASKVPHLLNVK